MKCGALTPWGSAYLIPKVDPDIVEGISVPFEELG